MYGDLDNTQESIESAGLSTEEFETVLKEKVAFGLTLRRAPIEDDFDRKFPVDVVEAHNYEKMYEDGF